ncbi:MAG TPA: FAD-dependent oxidoreductase, partial [Acidobacteriaceae bacterium]
RLRGMSVLVLERGQAMRGASWAAGGMLAVDDPQNPVELMELARLSARLYPEWLRMVEELSGLRVPMRTRQALQWVSEENATASEDEIRELAPGLRAPDGVGFRLLEEGSVDPRDLCVALPKAFAAAGGRLVEGCEVLGVDCAMGAVRVRTALAEFEAERFVECRGAWAGWAGQDGRGIPVEPVKGQMVELECSPERLRCVVRAPGVYLIPRGDGRVTVGSTIERVGFDLEVDERAIAGLVRAAREIVPELEQQEPLQCWAGLRPGTPDGLPVMGPALDLCEKNVGQRHWFATGHYRDGILLAPATARVMAQAIAGERPDVALEAFAPERFAMAKGEGE